MEVPNQDKIYLYDSEFQVYLMDKIFRLIRVEVNNL